MASEPKEYLDNQKLTGAKPGGNAPASLSDAWGAKDDVGAVHVAAKAQERDDLQHGIKDDSDGVALNTGRNRLGGAMAKGQASNQAEEERKTKQRHDDLMLMMLLDDIRDLERRIAENEERIEILDGQIEALESTLQALENGEDVLDENGELKDKRAEEAVKAFEEKHGVKIDRTDPGRLKEVLKSARAEKEQRVESGREMRRQKDVLENEADQTRERIKSHDDAIKLAQKGQLSEQEERYLELDNANRTDEEQVAVAKARRFDKFTEDLYVDSVLDNNSDSFFSDDVLGSENSFERGAVSSEFAQVADAKETGDKPAQETPNPFVDSDFDLNNMA